MRARPWIGLFFFVLTTCFCSADVGFVGQASDVDGNYSMGARSYDPQIGSFISKDPSGASAGVSEYQYCGDNPVNYTDPAGNFYWYQYLGTGVGLAGGAVETVVGGVVTFAGGTADTTGVLTLPGIAVTAGGVYLTAQGGAATYGNWKNLVYMIENPSKDSLPLNATGLFGVLVSSYEGTGAYVTIDQNGNLTQVGPTNGIASILDIASTADVAQALPAAFRLANLPGAVGQQALIAGIYTPPLAGTGEAWDNIGNILNTGIVLSGGADAGVTLGNGLGGSLPEPNNPPITEGGTVSVGGQPLDSTSSSGGVIDLGNGYSIGLDPSLSLNVGGVLINKAATLIGNLSSITGATYDPTSGQIIFLGSNSVNASLALNMDYFYTAVQSVYGDAAPPFVSLNFPATPATGWTDYGNNDGTWESGETNGFIMRYNPLWANVDTTIDVPVTAGWNGTNYSFTLHFQCYQLSQTVGGRPGMGLLYTGATNLPSGVTLSNASTEFSTGQTPSNFTLTANSQDGDWPVQLYNNTGHSLQVTGFAVIPARQHRQYGGRVDGTRLGWVMYEADRVMKCLAVGVDNLTGAQYNSSTVSVAGYKSILELDTAMNDNGGFSRLWFEPNQMTIERYVDPTSGQATMEFAASTISLLTQSYIEGQQSDPAAQAFCTEFENNYASFAAKRWPVLDPTDPTGTRIINEPIFAMLQQAMQAVSVARFFHDNSIPLDTSWMSTYQLPATYTPLSVPTAQNQGTTGNELLIYGGVEIITPNGYVPSGGPTGAQGVGKTIISARPEVPAAPTQDLKQQSWTSGSTNAVASSLSTSSQAGNLNLTQRDISILSPGSLSLDFTRYYQGSFTGQGNMGPGWAYPRYTLQFTNPSWYDEEHYMKDSSGNLLTTDAKGDTHLRSGTIRLVDRETGQQVSFQSSLVVTNSTNASGSPLATIFGLGTGDVPTFSANNPNGATLTQSSTAPNNYTLALPDGSSIKFDSNGNLLQITDRHGYSQIYSYDALSRLSTITDSTAPTPQTIVLAYDPTSLLLTSAAASNGMGVTYHYDGSGRLASAVDTASNVTTVEYQYNGSNQLVSLTRGDGTTPVNVTPDIKGRYTQTIDQHGNTNAWSYYQNTTDQSRTTVVYAPNSGLGTWQTGADSQGRLTYAKDPMGNWTMYGYTGTATGITSVQYPTPSDLITPGTRQPLTVGRNAAGLLTSISDPAFPNSKPVQVGYTSSQLPTHLQDHAGHLKDISYTVDNAINTVRAYHNGQNVDTVYSYTNKMLTSSTDALGHTWQYGRDGQGRLTSLQDPTGVTTGYDYDSKGRLWHIYDPKLSSPVVYGYDSLNRVVSVSSPSGTQTYAYDPVHQWMSSGTLTTADGQVSSVQYTHNNSTGDVTGSSTTFQLPSTVGGGTQTVATNYSYDSYGNLTTITPPAGSPINNNVNPLGQVTGVSTLVAGPSITANNATSGVWSTSKNQTFTWTAIANGSLTVSGYSYSEDAIAPETQNTVSNTATWNGIVDGQHTFHIRAQYSDGSWSAESIFNLWIDTTPPVVAAAISPSTIPLGTATVSINSTVFDPVPNWIDLLISRAGTANQGSSSNGSFTGGNMSLFSSINDSLGIYTRNPNVWTGTLDLSGISVDRNDGTYATGATLITPTDAVVAHHAVPAVGSTLTFVDNNNSVFTAKVSATANVLGDLDIAHLTWNGGTPTTLKIYKVLPSNYATALPNYDLNAFPIIAVNQFRQVFCQDAATPAFTNGTFYHGLSTEPSRSPYSLNIVGGDSSYPLFEDLNGEPILLGSNSSVGIATSVCDNIAGVNQVLASFAGDGYTLSTYSLTDYTAGPSSGLAPGFPQFSWCISSDSTRNWSALAPMSLVNGHWVGTFTEDGSQQVLYYQIQAQDNAGNAVTYSGSQILNPAISAQDAGYNPGGPLIYDATDNYFYGVCASGGANGDGTVYRVHPDGTGLQPIYTFAGPDGANPHGLVEDSIGNLYGTTTSGGPSNAGTIFKLTKSGTLVTYFNSGVGQLIMSVDGNMYGVNGEIIFKLTTAGTYSSLATVYSNISCLVEDPSNGILFGTTPSGGTNGYGSVFECTKAGVVTNLFSFNGSFNPNYPFVVPNGLAPLGLAVVNGQLYGCCSQGDFNQYPVYDGSQWVMEETGVLDSCKFFGTPQTGTPYIPYVGTGPEAVSATGIYTCERGGEGANAVYAGYGAVGGALFNGSNGANPTTAAITVNGNSYGVAGGGPSYRGVLYEAFGGGLASVIVSFSTPPSGLGPVGNELVASGQPTVFTVGTGTITATRPYSYQWQRLPSGGSTWGNLTDNSSYAGTATGSLTVSSTTTQMNGDQFRYVVANPYGSTASSSGTLTVMASLFTQQPQSQAVNIGGSVTLTAAVNGTGPFTYQWLENGTPIDGATSSSFTLTNFTPSDAGGYSVAVSDPAGTVVSNVANIIVFTPDESGPALPTWGLIVLATVLGISALRRTKPEAI